MIGTTSLEALGTTATLVVADAEALAAGRRLLVDELARIDRACSRFRTDSELSHANAHAGEPVPIGSLLAEAVGVALRAAEETAGLVSPTVGGHLRAAGYDRTFGLVRSAEPVPFVLHPPRVDAWRSVELDRTRGLLCVPRGVELDLGATAKGWAADRAAATIAEATDSGVLVSLGGDIAVAGNPPTGGWAIRIADDHRAPLDAPGPVVAISCGGLASSSTAVRRWRTTRGLVHHVFDPRTGGPAVTPWRLASVVASTCADANVAATYAVVAGFDAPGWLVARRLPARLVADDGSVTTLGGWAQVAEAA